MFSQGFTGGQESQQSQGLTQMTQMTQIDAEVATRSDPAAAASSGEEIMASPVPQPWLKLIHKAGRKSLTFIRSQ